MNIINEGPVANDVTMIMVTKVIEDWISMMRRKEFW